MSKQAYLFSLVVYGIAGPAKTQYVVLSWCGSTGPLEPSEIMNDMKSMDNEAIAQARAQGYENPAVVWLFFNPIGKEINDEQAPDKPTRKKASPKA